MSESLSRLTGYVSLDPTDVRLSRLTSYVGLDQTDIRLSRLTAYVSLDPVVAVTSSPQLLLIIT